MTEVGGMQSLTSRKKSTSSMPFQSINMIARISQPSFDLSIPGSPPSPPFHTSQIWLGIVVVDSVTIFLLLELVQEPLATLLSDVVVISDQHVFLKNPWSSHRLKCSENYFLQTMQKVLSNFGLGGFITLHLNCSRVRQKWFPKLFKTISMYNK